MVARIMVRIYNELTFKDSANLSDPDVLAREIIEDLEAALEQFKGIAEELGEEVE